MSCFIFLKYLILVIVDWMPDPSLPSCPTSIWELDTKYLYTFLKWGGDQVWVRCGLETQDRVEPSPAHLLCICCSFLGCQASSFRQTPRSFLTSDLPHPPLRWGRISHAGNSLRERHLLMTWVEWQLPVCHLGSLHLTSGGFRKCGRGVLCSVKWGLHGKA